MIIRTSLHAEPIHRIEGMLSISIDADMRGRVHWSRTCSKVNRIHHRRIPGNHSPSRSIGSHSSVATGNVDI